MKHSSNKIAHTTYILIAINLLLYAIEIRLGGSTNFLVLQRLGALIPEQVYSGEWWRLISANFLHYGWLHLTTNMLSLYVLGRIVEFNLGSKYYLIIYLASGIGSMSLFSLVHLKLGSSSVFLLGASAAIMGLIGTILAISLQIWFKRKNAVNTKRLLQVIAIVLLQFTLDNLIPQVSFYSHLFGFIIGFVISIFLVQAKLKLR